MGNTGCLCWDMVGTPNSGCETVASLPSLVRTGVQAPLAQACSSLRPSRSLRGSFSTWNLRGRQTFYAELARKAVGLCGHTVLVATATLPTSQGGGRGHCVSQGQGRGARGWYCCDALFASVLGLACFSGLTHLESPVCHVRWPFPLLLLSPAPSWPGAMHTALMGPSLRPAALLSHEEACAFRFPQSLGRGQQRQRLM